MSELSETYQAMKEHSREKKQFNSKSSKKLLIKKGIEFEEKNCGNHLIVKHEKILIDFWPSTGKWIIRNGKKGRGVFNLLKALNV